MVTSIGYLKKTLVYKKKEKNHQSDSNSIA